MGSSPIRVAIFGSVAQLVEQRTENPRVDGSIPSGGTNICGFSSSGRAPPCQGGGSEFEPRNPLQKSRLAFAGRLLPYLVKRRHLILAGPDNEQNSRKCADERNRGPKIRKFVRALLNCGFRYSKITAEHSPQPVCINWDGGDVT